ncbi:MAG: ABC transporter ATP-binding protein [Lachnospiraceae bacterium]|nr:ABC transporter ATP-binding protein [Lachnospiraceae bacterium]
MKTIKILAGEIREYKLPSILTPVFMVLEVIVEMLIPLLMARIVDDGVNGGNMEVIVKVGTAMLFLALGGLLTGVGGGIFGAKAATGFAKNLRKAMYENIQTFSFANIDKYSSSGLVTRLTTDVTNIQNAYQMLLRMFVRAPLSMIVAMTMAFIINAKIASIYLVAVAFLAFVLFFIMGKTTRFFKMVFKKYDAMNESVEENVHSIRVVKAYVREEYEKSKFQKAAENIYSLFVQAEKNMIMVMPIMMGTVYTVILLISWFGAHMIVGGSLTTGELMSLLAYCMNILMSLMFVAIVFVMVAMSTASAERIAEVLTEKSSLTNPENPVYEVADGSIDFDDVDFSYREGRGSAVLQDIDLHIKSGETIGIIGGTGSAKSSLVNLISRLYDVKAGSVRVGGLDVRDYDLDTLRRQVAVVLQKNVLFSGTILDNLRWGDPDATEEECAEACRMACADDFIRSFPDGYNTFITQGGTNVSGGQKQRLCIARALLRKPKILILDDSTSAVDTATDARIRAEMAKAMPGMTKLIITQRIISVEHADRVIVMDNGHVSGFDTPENLLKTNEIYRDVYETQMSGGGDFDQPAPDVLDGDEPFNAEKDAVSEAGTAQNVLPNAEAKSQDSADSQNTERAPEKPSKAGSDGSDEEEGGEA